MSNVSAAPWRGKSTVGVLGNEHPKLFRGMGRFAVYALELAKSQSLTALARLGEGDLARRWASICASNALIGMLRDCASLMRAFQNNGSILRDVG